MFRSLLKHMPFKSRTAGVNNKKFRVHERRTCDHCVIEMDGKMFPVKDWSYGGVLLTADNRLFAKNEAMNFKMKFRLPHAVHTIAHRGHVVRKTKDAIAVQFEPLTRDLRFSLQTVVDSAIA